MSEEYIWRINDDGTDVKVQKVVRCKDCKHKCVKGKTTRYHYCEIWRSAVDEPDFCSKGEKKDEIS